MGISFIIEQLFQQSKYAELVLKIVIFMILVLEG